MVLIQLAVFNPGLLQQTVEFCTKAVGIYTFMSWDFAKLQQVPRSDIYRCSHPNLSSHQSVLKLSGVQGLSCEGYNCSQQAARRPVVNHRSMEVGVMRG
ncbi:putative polypeptide N-acetylgalactosaminyltransferase 8 [Manis javanica]|nr:putative polypeptide N-acetylgalactosaminyltransferase 8 [Manis javanica]